MEKFTKGEWEVKPIEDDKEYIRIRGTVLGGRFKICNVNDAKLNHNDNIKWCAIERDESMANAHLIAAAPKMYAEIERECLELIEFIATLDEHSSDYYYYTCTLLRKQGLPSEARGE